MAVKESSQSVHPLLRLPAESIVPIKNWQEWKRLWEATPVAEFRFSLLQFGFDVAIEPALKEEEERICFYLQIANEHDWGGWGLDGEEKIRYVHTSFHKDRYPGTSLGPGNIRSNLARKAFKVLALRLFKDERKSESWERYPSWTSTVLRQGVLENVLWFFRPVPKGISNVDGELAEKGHHLEIVRQFLLDLCRLAWEFNYLEKEECDSDREIKERLHRHWPQFIEILFGLNRLESILENDWEVNDACLDKLEELATTCELSLGTYTDVNHRKTKLAIKPSSPKEALAAGSPAAQILALLRLRKKEIQRLESINAARAQLERAEREKREAEKTLQQSNVS